MSAKPNSGMTARCACGNVEFATAGAPILSIACYCDDCQEGARRIEALPGARRLMDPDGGSPYLLYRKDRVTCAKGGEFLRDERIKADSPTKRIVAACCNSGMYLDFEKGHWLSVFRSGFQGNVPPLEMRIQTRFKPGAAALPGDVPSYAAFPIRFLAKLVAARVAMLFGR